MSMVCFIYNLEQAKNLSECAKQYKDGSVAIENPCEEAADIFLAVRDIMAKARGKDLADQTKVSAAAYNQLLLMRRFVCLFNALA